jgi:N-acetylmuramoyl-L-alanine amidase
MKIQKKSSPNFDQRPPGSKPRLLVLHYTGMETMDAALARLIDPRARVSAHYFITEQGEILQLVEEANRAWHAGLSHWRGKDSVNDFSIGIELVNRGHEFGYTGFPEAQMASLEELCGDIVGRHAIEPINVVGHSDVAPGRKQDPGELFDWRRLAHRGVGLWLGEQHNLHELGLKTESAKTDWAALQSQLKALGYGLPISGQADRKTRDVLTAFQRHWRPQAVSGRADSHCLEVLDALLEVTV